MQVQAPRTPKCAGKWKQKRVTDKDWTHVDAAKWVWLACKYLEQMVMERRE